MKRRLTDYVVESGNWKVKIAMYDDECEGDYVYTEAATRAVEAVFGLRNFNMYCELISMKSLDGRDYFDVNNTTMVDMPQPMFSVIMCVYKASNELITSEWKLFLSSHIFANASQHINVDLALRAEKMESDKVNLFKQMVNKQRKNKKRS